MDSSTLPLLPRRSSLPPTGLLARFLPVSWLPYAELMRLDRPAGLFAFYIPYIIGLTYGACLAPADISTITLMRMGFILLGWCIVIRGWTCAWNDNLDQDFDRQVERCKLRPIARGAVSTTQAHFFTVFLFVFSFVYINFLTRHLTLIQTRDLNLYMVVLSTLGWLYPLGKRFTNYPQFILGLAFATGIFLACYMMGVDPFVDYVTTSSTVYLGVSNIFWAMIYDTIYAHQDLHDDLNAGVKSMAVKFKNSTKLMSAVLAVFQVGLLVKAGLDLHFGIWFFLFAVGGTTASMAAMITLVDLRVPDSCAWWFKVDFLLVGGSVSMGFFVQYLKMRGWIL